MVAPGAIATDFSGGLVRDNPEVNKLVAEMTALGRAGVPDDIGPMIPCSRGQMMLGMRCYCFGRTTLMVISLLETVVLGTCASNFTTFSCVPPAFSISATLPRTSPSQHLGSAFSVE